MGLAPSRVLTARGLESGADRPVLAKQGKISLSLAGPVMETACGL